MESSRRHRQRQSHARGNPEGDSIIKKSKYKVPGQQTQGYFTDGTDFGASPVKRRKQHG